MPTSGRRQPRTLRPPGAPRAVPGTRRSPTATEGTRGAPTPLAPGLAAVRSPAARGAPRASQRGERGCRLSSPRGPSSAGSGSPRPALPPQRCPARSPASRPPPPPLPLRSLSPPARSQPPRRCRRINMADGRVRATSRGRERGRAELRRSPAPGQPPGLPGQRSGAGLSHPTARAVASPPRQVLLSSVFLPCSAFF